jgi:hypothetical protein
LLGLFSLSFCGALAFLFGALPFEFRGPSPLLLGGAFLFPSGGAIPFRGMPITFLAAAAPQGVIRPCGAVRGCGAVRQRVAIWLRAEAAGIGDRDRPGRGQAWQRRRIVICLRPAWGR